MKFHYKILSTCFVLLSLTTTLGAQSLESEGDKPHKKTWRDEWTLPTWGIKTNLLYDATTTINIGFEFRTGPKNSLEIPINWNPWGPANGGTKIKHILIQPEFRWWPNGVFNGNSFGIHAHYTPDFFDGVGFNIGELPAPPFTKYMNRNRFEGWLAGVGLSWGYRWNFNRHWALEAAFGIGYTYLEYNRYGAEECGPLCGFEKKHYFGITKAGINLIYGMGAKRKSARPVVPPASETVVVIVPEPVVEPHRPRPAVTYMVPQAEAVKARRESGKAYLEFTVGSSEIVSDYRGNGDELARINDMIGLVNSDPDVTIRRMLLTGYASPDGDFWNNMTLSEKRAQSLREYLEGIYGLDNNITSRGGGEDWKGLEEFVEASSIAYKDVLLDIIHGSDDYDVRERKLRSVMAGRPYRALSTEIYPRLRRTDYVIEYDVAPIDIERGKEILKTRPSNLSLNEMFRIAQTYEPGSPEFNEVFDIAARVFPDSDVANMNAAANALEREDTASARKYLDRVKEHDEAWWNNMGVLFRLEGDTD